MLFVVCVRAGWVSFCAIAIMSYFRLHVRAQGIMQPPPPPPPRPNHNSWQQRGGGGRSRSPDRRDWREEREYGGRRYRSPDRRDWREDEEDDRGRKGGRREGGRR